ncbi:MAG: hypothetical protein JW953_21200 [Anaerolineae bacterium]|nr:hypothetical protein [Anaerolineae bacterium]
MRLAILFNLLTLLLGLAFFIIPAPTSQAEPALSVGGWASGTYPGGETTYRLQLLNHTDQIVYDGVLTITLPISFTYIPGSTIAMGEGWPLESHEPAINGQTLTWGPYHLPAAGIEVHNPYGIHTMVYFCENAPPGLHLDGAKELAGNGGYLKQLFSGLNANTTGPGECAVNYVLEAYARNLIPVLRLQGEFVNGLWQAPDPGPNGDYAEIAQAYARFVAGLPRRDTNPLYIEVWNEPNLWIEWSGSPNPTQYARFFVAVSNAIHRLGDARIRVVNGAIVPTTGHLSFLSQMLAVPGFKDAFDVWASHCYPYNHPASYNNHNGTARYGEYAIDCYTQEVALLNAYGRSNVKVILTETGYELGNNVFGFEGFSPINETNRAAYISDAFSAYWQNWPEVVTVTPFQLSDTSGQWANFDWVYPTWPYPKHPQFEAVAALPKPAGELRPYGYQITFRAIIGPDVVTGTYPSQLSGSERNGHTAFVAEAAPVEVQAQNKFQLTYYLPIIFRAPGQTGPWYHRVDQISPPGAIVPSHFLKAGAALQSAGLSSALNPMENCGCGPGKQPFAFGPTLPAGGESFGLAGEPRALALAETAGLGAIILADASNAGGSLQIFVLDSGQPIHTISFDHVPQAISTDTPVPGQAYLTFADSVALVDLPAGEVVNQVGGLGRPRGLARDAATHRLFVADAKHERLLVLSDDLLQLLAALPLAHQPNQVIFDPAARRLYLSLPAGPQVIALDADTLDITAQTPPAGGPILDLAFDAERRRLYALSALAPDYRGLAVWQTPTLQRVALVGGGPDFPLRTASALALTPTGQLLASETTGLWQITPNDFSVSRVYSTANQAPPAGLAMGQSDGVIYMLETQSPLLRIFR